MLSAISSQQDTLNVLLSAVLSDFLNMIDLDCACCTFKKIKVDVNPYDYGLS